jgi:uncharacterized SAM-binding protein YcdF (DUF218 family)
MSNRREDGKRHQRTRTVVVLTAVAIAALLTAGPAGTALVVREPIDRPDAIVSLASHEWERLPEVARQSRTFNQAKVVLTVPPVVSVHNCHECSTRMERLNALGVDNARVRMVSIAKSGTHGEACAVLAFARSEGMRRVLVVTSPYHTRRAFTVFHSVFRGSGIGVGIQPAMSESGARPSWWWIHGYDRAYVVYEWAAITYYAWTLGIYPMMPTGEGVHRQEPIVSPTADYYPGPGVIGETAQFVVAVNSP